MENRKIIKQNLDLNLYYLYELLLCTGYCVFDDDTQKEIDNLVKFIYKKLFKNIPHGYDIYDTKCVYYTYLESNN